MPSSLPRFGYAYVAFRSDNEGQDAIVFEYEDDMKRFCKRVPLYRPMSTVLCSSYRAGLAVVGIPSTRKDSRRAKKR